MNIAMVCPLDEPVSPSAETEPHRTIGRLAESLVAAGHQVTLFAREGSSGGSELVPAPAPGPPGPDAATRLGEALQLAGVLAAIKRFDMVHNHAGPAAAALLHRADRPLLSTIHRPCSPEEVEGWRRLGDGARLDAAPDIAPAGLPLAGAGVGGAGVGAAGEAQACLDLYRAVIDGLENHRPWGHYVVLEDRERHKVKRIVVNPGQRLSLQLHHRRAEHWMVIEGEGLVTVGDEEILVRAGEAIDIPREAKHRIRNPGDVPCVFIEVQTGDYFGEDDIVRLEDDYGRSG